MAINFPANPNIGDTYVNGNNTWQYDGQVWNIITNGAPSYPTGFSNVIGFGKGTISANTATDTLSIVPGENISLEVDSATNSLTISSKINEVFSFNIAADDSSQKVISSNETIQFIGGTGITTNADPEGNITIASTAGSVGGISEFATAGLTIDKIYEPASVMFRLGNVGQTAYTFAPHYTGDDPTIVVIAGTTVAFDLDNISGLPFQIQNPAGDPYNTGLVHVSSDGTVSTGANANTKDSGTLYWRVPEDIFGTYRYECPDFITMFGAITIKRASLL